MSVDTERNIMPPEKEKQLRFLNFTLGSLLRTQGVFSTPWKSGYFPEKGLSMRHTGLASHPLPVSRFVTVG